MLAAAGAGAVGIPIVVRGGARKGGLLDDDGDDTWRHAIVTAFDPVQHRHTLKFTADGKVEQLALWGNKKLEIHAGEHIRAGDDEPQAPPPQRPQKDEHIVPGTQVRPSRRRSNASHGEDAAGAAADGVWDASAKAHAMAALCALSCVRRPGGEYVALAFEELPSSVIYPDYYVVVKQPVSLASLRWDLHNAAFTTRTEFLSAVERMFVNAQTYNLPQSQPHADADTLRALFASELAKRPRAGHADTAGRVGHRLRVWWPDDGAFFSATVIAHAPARLKQCHFVRYDDGFSEWLDVSEPQLRVQWIDSGNGAAQAKRASARLSGPGGKDAAPSDWGQPAALIPALRRRSMHKST